MKRLAASAAVLGLLFFRADPAEACSPACIVPKLAPVAGSSVPASAPGLLLIGPSADTSAVQLVDGTGTPVPGSFQTDAASGRKYFAPSTALAPGSYATRAAKACNSSEIAEATFTVTATAPLPTATGTASVKKSARESLSAWTSSGSCTEPVDAAYVDLDLAIDAALAPYAAIVTWQTKVDGKEWASKDPIDANAAPSGNARSYLRLFTPCDGNTTGRDPGLVAGVHSVEIRAFLPGGAALSAATVSVTLSCDGDDIVGDGEIPGGGSGNPSEGSGTSFGSSGGRSSSSGSSSGATAPYRSQDGCSATPSLGSSSPSILGAIVALLAVAGLRRRRNAVD